MVPTKVTGWFCKWQLLKPNSAMLSLAAIVTALISLCKFSPPSCWKSKGCWGHWDVFHPISSLSHRQLSGPQCEPCVSEAGQSWAIRELQPEGSDSDLSPHWSGCWAPPADCQRFVRPPDCRCPNSSRPAPQWAQDPAGHFGPPGPFLIPCCEDSLPHAHRKWHHCWARKGGAWRR